MENNKTEQLEMNLRQTLRGCAIAIIICTIGFIRAVNRSNIRTVDLLPLVAFGIAFGAFLVTLRMVYKVKKMNGTK